MADMLSARIPQVLGYQVVDILLRSLFLLGLFIPAFSIAILKTLPAAPTNGFPFSSSFLPGASPVNTNLAEINLSFLAPHSFCFLKVCNVDIR